jgi:hypothetical protein
MDKPRYEKPIVLDLNGNSANGAPLWCGSGSNVDPSSNVCYSGTNGYQDLNDCKSGVFANTYPGACTTGGTASWECSSGGVNSGTVGGTCTSGPSPV